MKHLLVAAAAVVTLNMALSAQAAEPLLSPKAKALADSLRKVPSAASDVDVTKDRPIGNAKAWELARSRARSAPFPAPARALTSRPARARCSRRKTRATRQRCANCGSNNSRSRH